VSRKTETPAFLKFFLKQVRSFSPGKIFLYPSGLHLIRDEPTSFFFPSRKLLGKDHNAP